MQRQAVAEIAALKAKADALADMLETILSDEEVALSRPDYEAAVEALAAYRESGQ
jgi:hypothetical protein